MTGYEQNIKQHISGGGGGIGSYAHLSILLWVFEIKKKFAVRNLAKFIYFRFYKNSITPLIRNNFDGEPSGYAENPDNWIFL